MARATAEEAGRDEHDKEARAVHHHQTGRAEGFEGAIELLRGLK
jgi:hypothetical protein